MSFFERRKKLKEINFLELKPLPLCESIINEKNLVTVLIPKFKNRILVKYVSPLLKSPNIKLNLDILGSAVWKLLNGKNSVQEISDIMKQEFGDKEKSLEERILKFLTELYVQNLITFEEIKGV